MSSEFRNRVIGRPAYAAGLPGGRPVGRWEMPAARRFAATAGRVAFPFMPHAHDGTPAVPAALRRCPGCRNQVTTRTPLCPVCGRHATAARLASVARWAVLLAGSAALVWWWHHHG